MSAVRCGPVCDADDDDDDDDDLLRPVGENGRAHVSDDSLSWSIRRPPSLAAKRSRSVGDGMLLLQELTKHKQARPQ